MEEYRKHTLVDPLEDQEEEDEQPKEAEDEEEEPTEEGERIVLDDSFVAPSSLSSSSTSSSSTATALLLDEEQDQDHEFDDNDDDDDEWMMMNESSDYLVTDTINHSEKLPPKHRPSNYDYRQPPSSIPSTTSTQTVGTGSVSEDTITKNSGTAATTAAAEPVVLSSLDVISGTL